MQNIDLYTGGNTTQRMPPPFTPHESDFFSRVRENTSVSHEKQVKRASRIIFFIAALCIISFTTGLALGIKFAGGENTQIVDDSTYEAMGQIKEKVAGLVSGGDAQKQQYPADQYPYMLRIGTEHKLQASKDIAAYLHSMGHSVVLSPNSAENKIYRIYTGPYSSLADAEKDMTKIETYKKYSIADNITRVKRK